MTIESQLQQIENEDKASLKDLILKIKGWGRYILSKWVFILFFGLVGAGLGFYYAYKTEPAYTATTTFVMEDEKGSGGLSSLAGLASMAGVDLGGGGGGLFQGDNLPELYKSRSMIEKTLLSPSESHKGKLLINLYIDFNSLQKKWKDKPALSNIDFSSAKPSRLRDSLLGTIVDDIKNTNLSVGKPDKKLSILKVDVRSKDEVFSKEFNDKIVENVNNFFLQTKTKKSLSNIAILQRKTDSVRAVMNGAIYSSAAISDATPNLNPTRQVQRTAPIQRSQFNAETNKTILGGLVQNLELTKMSLLKETPLIQVVDQPVYPLTKETYSKSKGIILGFILFALITAIFIFLKELLRRAMAEN